MADLSQVVRDLEIERNRLEAQLKTIDSAISVLSRCRILLEFTKGDYALPKRDRLPG